MRSAISSWLMQKISYWYRRYWSLMWRSSVKMMALYKSWYVGNWFFRRFESYLSYMFETWCTAHLKWSILLVFVVFDPGGFKMCCVDEPWKYFVRVVLWGCEIRPARRRLSGLGAMLGWDDLVYEDVRCFSDGNRNMWFAHDGVGPVARTIREDECCGRPSSCLGRL